ncbi:chalcone isomerase family protein [Roseateles koreensis]|uniref:Chalcone isomerase family protein n=1 Tax=Roseateles koreensis TaxID=2987526 RepID=A0ABT5KT62_9BURK|nr:chalcone isomerase family protein [Roseateles koreensis]MDC8785046.1 chalcone isomerase family protein [Roseateles koreensis]
MRVNLIAVALALLAPWSPLLTPAAVAQTPTNSATPASIEVSGVKLDTQVDIGGQMVPLNGAGVRYKAIFKVYVAALYLGKKTDNAETALTSNSPKRLHITMLREVDATELGKLFTKGIEQNATREEFARAINGVLRVGEVFSSRKSLSAGEHFWVDYIPGTGSVISLNGKVQGAPIKEPEFYAAFLRVWLGKAPADDFLKDALLGIKRSSRGAER